MYGLLKRFFLVTVLFFFFLKNLFVTVLSVIYFVHIGFKSERRRRRFAVG